MANYHALDRTFAALGDPTRRGMLARLERAPLTVSELARPYAIQLPTILKHLDVLAAAGLVSRRKRGRTVTVTLRAQPLRSARTWLDRYERFWNRSFDRLATLVEQDVP